MARLWLRLGYDCTHTCTPQPEVSTRHPPQPELSTAAPVAEQEFCVDLGFVDAGFTLRDAASCFVRSRMQAVDECSEEGWARITTLCFEDFLEAFVRAAAIKALPTDAEIDQAGLSDAGQFLLTMQRKRPEAYQDFLRERAVDPLHPGAAQPVARCVEHLCMLMVRVVERAAQAEGDAKIAHMEAAKLDLKSGKAKDSPSKDREKFLAAVESPRKVPQHRDR